MDSVIRVDCSQVTSIPGHFSRMSEKNGREISCHVASSCLRRTFLLMQHCLAATSQHTPKHIKPIDLLSGNFVRGKHRCISTQTLSRHVYCFRYLDPFTPLPRSELLVITVSVPLDQCARQLMSLHCAPPPHYLHRRTALHFPHTFV